MYWNQSFCTQLTKAYVAETSCIICYWFCYVSAHNQFAQYWNQSLYTSLFEEKKSFLLLHAFVTSRWRTRCVRPGERLCQVAALLAFQNNIWCRYSASVPSLWCLEGAAGGGVRTRRWPISFEDRQMGAVDAFRTRKAPQPEFQQWHTTCEASPSSLRRDGPNTDPKQHIAPWLEESWIWDPFSLESRFLGGIWTQKEWQGCLAPLQMVGRVHTTSWAVHAGVTQHLCTYVVNRMGFDIELISKLWGVNFHNHAGNAINYAFCALYTHLWRCAGLHWSASLLL